MDSLIQESEWEKSNMENKELVEIKNTNNMSEKNYSPLLVQEIKSTMQNLKLNQSVILKMR